MVSGKDLFSGKNGLHADPPLGSRIGRITVGVRPVDPLLMERISNGIGDLAGKGLELPENCSLAVRSIDGFYYIPVLRRILGNGDPAVMSVVNYDPVRRTFILSGNGDPDDLAEFFWFAFEGFPSDMFLFHDGGEDPAFNAPDNYDERISFDLSLLRMWKAESPLKDGTSIFWRGPDLHGFLEFLEGQYSG